MSILPAMLAIQARAIETRYNGYRFRSRLEARWAVFFDTLGIEYRYEVEGFDLNGIWYLPDFWLPKPSCWLEIKPVWPTREECEKAIRLCIGKRQSVFILAGDVWPGAYKGIAFLPLPDDEPEAQCYLADNYPPALAPIHLRNSFQRIRVPDEQDDYIFLADLKRHYMCRDFHIAQCSFCAHKYLHFHIWKPYNKVWKEYCAGFCAASGTKTTRT